MKKISLKIPSKKPAKPAPDPGADPSPAAAPSVPLLVSLVRAMRDCCQEHERQLSRKLAVTPSELACLLAIPRHDDEFSVHEVAKLMGLSQSRASRVIDSLASDGLLHRRTADSDRRTQLLALSPAGLKKWHAARKLMVECEERVLSKLTSEDTRELEEILKTLVKVWPTDAS